MKRSSLIFMIFITGCADGTTPLADLFNFPANAVTDPTENAIYTARRGQVELVVKSDFPAIIPEIAAGGGPKLQEAFNAAGVPAQDRPTRVFQLQRDLALYANNPGALVTAITVFGS